ncbi:hypothetical protein [Collinsella tanakaei]|uniref:hypothetical protein n=1 Tax=Collinsella tanakaei TaxID=626935 RepID=UPI0025A3FFC2|nr:hypothetical protein [Collinsella tanakaei]MDM8301998.1 hypothetical protein [Collinsella tanakaei]
MHLRAAIIVLACLGAVVGIAGCVANGTRHTEGSDTKRQEFEGTAMALRLGDDSLLFVDRDTETPFVPTAIDDAEIIGIDGATAAPEDLEPGNIVRITGNGIMLESYPGQYPGITRVEVIDEGTPEDAEAYDELVAQLWNEPDPSQPASASLDYTTDLAAVSLLPLTNGFTWSFKEDGQMQTVVADVPHPTQISRDDIPDARIDGAIEAALTLDRPARSVSVTRWSEDDIAAAAEKAGSPSDIDTGALSGEQVECGLVDSTATLTIEPGWRYCVTTTFDEGAVNYVFTAR